MAAGGIQDAETGVVSCCHNEGDTADGCMGKCQRKDEVDKRTRDEKKEEPLKPPGDFPWEDEERKTTYKGYEG